MPMNTRNEMRPVRPAHYADSFWATYVISIAAASVAETVTYPLDLTKTRLQIQGEAATSGGAAKNVVSLERSYRVGVSEYMCPRGHQTQDLKDLERKIKKKKKAS